MIDLDKKRKRQVEWKMNRRRDAVRQLGGKCVDCGSTENLEFDHVDPATKLYEMTNIWSRKLAIRVAEIAKCVLRCKDCHIIKTVAERTT